MQKPNNYDDISTRFDPIEQGGHKCILKKVEALTSSTGKPMLKISFDTSKEDIQPEYFSAQWLRNKKEDKKWQGVSYLMLPQKNAEDWMVRNLKMFCTSVEDSNPGFEVKWLEDDNQFAAQFTGMKIGIVFRLEEGRNTDGSISWWTKPWQYRNYDKVLNEPVPERKRYTQQTASPMDYRADDNGFAKVSDDTEGLPFI